ncbi:hypothetical protein [Schlegelella aquatica]|uniref:hypothetical protein n=1 Tax=Caldimonas aquatica TaxID=376175 RepID=UPI003753110F
MKTQDGRLYVIAGASRSGKTAWTRKQTVKARRVFAWDPEDQWAQLPGFRKVTKRAELLHAAQQSGPLKVAFVAGGNLAEAFDFWAGCVMYAGRYVGPLDAIAEELADVTTPAKAPGNWGILLRRGLKRGISIWCISQRWSEADKTAVGNASDFVVFRQSSGDDVRYLARKTRIPEAEIEALAPLQFVHMDALTGTIKRGRLSF